MQPNTEVWNIYQASNCFLKIPQFYNLACPISLNHRAKEINKINLSYHKPAVMCVCPQGQDRATSSVQTRQILKIPHYCTEFLRAHDTPLPFVSENSLNTEWPLSVPRHMLHYCSGVQYPKDGMEGVSAFRLWRGSGFEIVPLCLSSVLLRDLTASLCQLPCKRIAYGFAPVSSLLQETEGWAPLSYCPC